MILAHITEKYCTCGARSSIETQDRMHTNGHWFESRQYACGRRVQYVPNFYRIEELHPCPKSPEYMERKAKFDAAKKELMKQAQKLLNKRRFLSLKSHIDCMNFSAIDFYDR